MSLLGGVRLEAHYSAFGRAMAMVFHFRSIDLSPPTPSICKLIAEVYGLWENDGALVGYFLLRSSDSSFRAANVWSVDPRSKASFVDEPFSRPGFIPSLAFGHLPTSMAPVVRWATAERGKATGRTYAVGLSEAVNDGESDKEKVNGLYLDSLASIFGALGPSMVATVKFSQCHLARSHRGGVVDSPTLLDITGCGVYERMGSQRRRTRPGHPPPVS